jgi:DNA-binding CsgD family transcriptional regulator
MTSWDPPPLPPRLIASRQLPLVGRRFELETFERLWEEVELARRQVVFVGGEPGAGKTRLVAEVAGALYDDGNVVLVGTSSIDAGVPYEPFAQMLDQLFAGAAEGSLAALLESDARELRRLSPAIDRHRSDFDGRAGELREVRRDLFDAVAGLFRLLAADRPLTLILDDLHWAQVPTLAMFEHVVHVCPDIRMLVVATFRTTTPDRSDELAARVAELHRLEGVRRLDLSGLDTDAIAEYVSLRAGLPVSAARAPAAVLRDRTGGNPFFLRELWTDVERAGGVSALRFPHRVPASIADTLAARLAGLGEEVRLVIELAAVLGDTFDLTTLVAASEMAPDRTIAFVDSATAAGLVEAVEGWSGRYSFVHSLTREAVLDRMPSTRRATLHARAAEALERQPAQDSLVPRLAHHYLVAHILGYHDQALHYTRKAGELAATSLAFEEAATWFERAASLPECDSAVQAELLFAAAANYVRAGRFPQARAIYERLAHMADPMVRLAAAMGFEDTNWRPGLTDARAADLLSSALEDSHLDQDDDRYVRALASLGRAFALCGETDRARDIGGRAIDLARRLGDEATLGHALTTSLWHGITPEVAETQRDRTTELARMAKAANDYEALGSAVNFLAMVGYLRGRRGDLDAAIEDSRRSAQGSAQPYYRYIYACLMQAQAFMSGDFEAAEQWAQETLEQHDTFGDDMTEGPHGVQMFMIRRETGALTTFRRYLDGSETFKSRWVPGLLALYTELAVEPGIRRALQHLLDRDLVAHADEAQWPMELVFMVEGALALQDAEAVRSLRPLLTRYTEMNLVSGTLIATFGSADRYLGRVAAFLGDHAAAERHFAVAHAMDQGMRSVVHLSETLAHHAVFAASVGQSDRARLLAQEARDLADPIGQRRVLRLLESVERPAGPGGLTEREVDVLRLLAAGLSNREIGARLHISANTAANHIRSILMKTGAANRTQAAMYAAQHQLV